MTERYNTPDARQLADMKLPAAAFPAAQSDFRVYFDAETHANIVRHAAEDKSVEICGVLVGRWQQDADGPFVAVSQCIRCDEAAKKSGEVTFTHEAWNTINREMDTRYVDLKIVGWYHSHPGFGIFLSERDVFIHEHFFSNPGQVAMVVDPSQKIEGVFVWRDGKPKPCSHYWIGGIIHAGSDRQEPDGTGAAETTVKMAPSPPREDAGFFSILRFALPLAAMLLIGYLLGGMKTAWEQQRIIEGTVAHFGTWKCLRPGLRENLHKVADDLKVIRAATNDLAMKQIQAAGDAAADEKAKWNKVSLAMSNTEENLRLLGAVYGLDAAEMAAYKAVFADKLEELHRPAKEEAAPKEKSQPTDLKQKPSQSNP
jgi:proteasome lid subunit RPN8/RPN11